MTATLLGTGRQVAVLVAVDHGSAGCLGIHAATRGTRFEALQPIRQGVREGFGAIGKDLATGPIVRHEQGSQYIGHDFRNEGARLGATASPSFVRAPEGKGCAERSEARRDTRAGRSARKLHTRAGEVQLQGAEASHADASTTAIIERYRRRARSLEEASIEMYLAGVSVVGWRPSPRPCGARG